MAYRFTTTSDYVEFAIAPLNGYAFGPFTWAALVKRNGVGTNQRLFNIVDSAISVLKEEWYLTSTNIQQINSGGTLASGAATASSTSVWYLLAVTRPTAAGTLPRFHAYDGVSWTHANSASSMGDVPALISSDRLQVSSSVGTRFNGDIVCMGIKKSDSTDVAVEALSATSFSPWANFGFDWLIGFDSSLVVATRLQDQATPGTGDEIAKSGTTLVSDPPGWSWAVTPPTTYAWDFGDSGTSTATSPSHTYTNPGVYTVSLTATNAAGSNTKTRTNYVTVNSVFVPQIIWLTPAAASGTPAVPTYESSIAYASVANRPAVTGTTRTFTSSATLTTALNAASAGDLVQYTGTGILDIAGNYTGFAGRRYAGYVNVDLGLAASANHVRFTGGGGAGLPAVGIYNSQYLRIYGGEITNPPPKSTGHDGLHIYGAGHAHDGSTNHVVWWNLVVHDTVDSGIKMLPNVPFGGSGQTAADNTIADCDIEATVYMIGRDKTVDTHPEPGTGQHCCLLADTDPAGATYPSFLRNRVAIDGYNTGLSAGQGGGSIVELGFNDSLSTISGCTLILRGNNTLFNAQQQTAGNGLNLWGDAPIGCAVPFLQHSNATGSAVCNFPPGYNRSGVVVAYGRHTNTNQNAYEGVNPWQIGPTYVNVA